MNSGHSARQCRNRPPSPSRSMEGGPPGIRLPSFAAFLPPRQLSPGLTPLLGRAALAECLCPTAGDPAAALTKGLAAKFGGSSSDYKVAPLTAPTMAVIFPSWVTRESAIARSPLRVDQLSFRLSNWVEAGEIGRRHLLHKVWIKLKHWPLLCWNKEDVLAAVSGFGQLWDVDEACEEGRELSFFRVNIRCQHYQLIPKVIHLHVEDRRFSIPIEIESWDRAAPILLGEGEDRRLGLTSVEEQETFIRTSGFSDFNSGREARSARPPTLAGAPAPEFRRQPVVPRPSLDRRSPRGKSPAFGPLVPPSSSRSLGGSLTAPATFGGDDNMQQSALETGVSSLPDAQLDVPPDSSPTLLSLADWPPLGPGPSHRGGCGPPLWARPPPSCAPSSSSAPLATDGPPLAAQPSSLVDPSPEGSSPPSQPSPSSPSGSSPILDSLLLTPGLDRHLRCKRSSLRRSIRLASKYRGNNLPSLLRAQALRCKKLRPPCSAAMSRPPQPSSQAVPPSPPSSPAGVGRPPAPPRSSSARGRQGGSLGERPPSLPLSPEEVDRIKVACGIVSPAVDSSAPAPAPNAVVLACPAPGTRDDTQ